MAVDDESSGNRTKKSINQSRRQKRTVKTKIPNEIGGTENQKPPRILRKPLIIWNKTNLIRTVLGLFIFTLIPFVWWLIYEVRPTLRAVNRMTGEWNVAIVNFSNINTDLNRADVLLISSTFSNRLQKEIELQANDANLVVQVWGPQQVDQSIPGRDTGERATAAEKLAAKLNADMIIYGTIREDKDGYLLQPEFFIRTENHYEVDELVGDHRFGGPISIAATRTNLSSQLPLNIELARRSQILALVAKGLSFYLVNSYDQAYDLFTQANQDDLWRNPVGRETIYLFQGNAAIRDQNFEEAQLAYNQAVQINPAYGRGYIGLGNVTYAQALASANQQAFTPDQQGLEQAKAYYQQALQASQADNQSSSAEIPSKAAFGMGQILMTEWFAGQDTHDNAIEQFNTVLENYDNGKNTRLQELASETHARLGVIYRQDQQLELAITELQQALDLSTLPARKGLYNASLSSLYNQEGKLKQAQDYSNKSIEQYQLAISLPMSNELRASYWSKIGEQYEFLKATDQAINAYEQALNLLPTDSASTQIIQENLDRLQP